MGFDASGAGKGAGGWLDVTAGQVYVDHPVHARSRAALAAAPPGLASATPPSPIEALRHYAT
ncbi:hypothetical protein GCM10009682_40880 [Luedemannella flava]|uniref:Uncharacterized protein n=1 Tax=Luedemannella flava TaxID=349316 RepID=A0ABP4YLP9_9ACTN